MKIDELVDMDELWRLVADHYVTARDHPRVAGLTILNYTAKTQFERAWTPVTELCRGLMFDACTNEVVARPFRKFFNLGEREGALPDESFSAHEKLDGSLAISYIDADGLPSLATRGSFVSEQAIRATGILRDRYRSALPWIVSHPLLTLCFEAILPENRIVVDYAGREDVVFLAAFDRDTGAEVDPLATAIPDLFPMARTWQYGSLDEAMGAVEGPDFDGQEGVVIRFAGGLRVKIKREDYVRLHRLVTGVTPRRIWQMLKDGTPPIWRLYAGTPEPFAAWARERVGEIEGRHAEILAECRAQYAEIAATDPPDRKAFALAASKACHPSVLFKLYDGRDPAEIAWKLVYPPAANPFRVEVE